MNEYAKVLIPMIRKVMPTTIAQQIVGVQPMTGFEKEYINTIWGKTYNKKYWPYQYTINRDEVFEAERWCWQHFKGRNWNNTHRMFAFKRSRDAVMFALRWA